MNIGVIKEIKDKENRVSLTPEGAKTLVDQGHQVQVQQDAGVNSGFSNEEYEQAGASLVDVETAWGNELILKVKEPMEDEYTYFKENQIIFTYFHLAGVTKTLTEALLASKTTAIAYETVEDENKRVPLLAPMSAVAGNMSITIGNYYLAKFNNGNGVQLGSVLGKKNGKVVIIGDGVVGKHAAKTALGIGTNVYLFSLFEEKFHALKQELGEALNCVVSNKENVAEHVKDADVVIGGVYVHGSKAPYVVTEDMVKTMKPGSVIIDVAIDQGGCIETSKPTSHTDPVFVKHGVTHYCVTNMPGTYPRTSTLMLTQATQSYVEKLASGGMSAVLSEDGFKAGVNTYKGFLCKEPVAKIHNLEEKYKDVDAVE